MEQRSLNVRIIARIATLLVAGVFFGRALYLDMGFLPSRTFELTTNSSSPIISSLYPYGRVERNEINNVSTTDVIVEPVYFDVRVPQGYQNLKISLEYGPTTQELVQLGILKDTTDWGYDFSTVDYKKLNELNWDHISEGEYSLWQKKKKYNSISDFNSHASEEKGVVYYNTDYVPNFRIPGYTRSNTRLTLNHTLRGMHQMYTYIGKGEPLDFNFITQDINRNVGADIISLSVYDMGGNLKFNQTFPDDGRVSDKDGASAKRTIALYQTGLPEGAYKIDFRSNDDILIRSINTAQQYLSFINRVYPVESREYADGLIDLSFEPSILFTNSNAFSFKTHHKLGLQTIQVGDDAVELSNTFAPVSYSNTKFKNKVVIPNNDVIVIGNGLFSFSQKMYINPKDILLSDTTDLTDVNFILARYIVPDTTSDNWKSVSALFSLSNRPLDHGNTKIMISSPYLNERNTRISIRKITATFTRDGSSNLSWKELWSNYFNTWFQ